MIVPLTKQEKKKNCFERTHNPLYIHSQCFVRKKIIIWTQLINWNSRERLLYKWMFDIFFFLFSKWRNAIERESKSYIHVYMETTWSWIGILARRRHRLIITTLSPPLNALINVIGPISDRRWLPACSLSSSIIGWLLRRKLRSKRRRKSQFISFQAGRRG